MTAKLTVMHVSDCYLPRLGGIEVQVAELAGIQAAAGHPVHVVTATPAHAPDTENGDAPLLHRVVAPLPFELPVHPRAARALAHVLDGVAPDVVHVHVGAVSPFAWTAVAQAVRAGLPTVVSVHSMWDPFTSGDVPDARPCSVAHMADRHHRRQLRRRAAGASRARRPSRGPCHPQRP